MNILVKITINTIAVFVAAKVLSGVHVDSLTTALVVAVILGVVNAFIKPILFLLTLPLTILTLGIFSFILNALMVLLVDRIVPGFSVDNLLWALLFSLVVSLISSFLETLTKS